MTKRVTIEKSKLFFVIPKIISVIPYPYNYLVSYLLSLKLFCPLSLIPKTPNRASALEARSKELKKDGKGNKPKAAEAITDEEVNILYDKQLLGISNAGALLRPCLD